MILKYFIQLPMYLSDCLKDIQQAKKRQILAPNEVSQTFVEKQANKENI